MELNAKYLNVLKLQNTKVNAHNSKMKQRHTSYYSVEQTY